MIKFDLLCAAIFAYLIAVAHTQNDCQACTNTLNQVMTCTDVTNLDELQYVLIATRVKCGCYQDLIDGYASCPYCSTYDSYYFPSVSTVVSTCQKYNYSVTVPSSTNTAGSDPGSSNNSPLNDGSSNNSPLNNRSSNNSSNGGLSKGAIIGLASAGVLLAFLSVALVVYYKWLKVKKVKDEKISQS
ncbi:9847_t:CDS:2 [Ambispora gerdemannii]|uniref:9847_t:CDS:1 n=1 Tax=Ambispora gerdemannii TaxID=144530 RepID=A0A9N9G4P2_9GLOM|nr:9847_t:CDS:2 [Ambispora gerdemannii]